MMKARTTPQRSHRRVAQQAICLPLLLACLVVAPNAATAADSPKTEANRVAEITFDAAQPHAYRGVGDQPARAVVITTPPRP